MPVMPALRTVYLWNHKRDSKILRPADFFVYRDIFKALRVRALVSHAVQPLGYGR